MNGGHRQNNPIGVGNQFVDVGSQIQLFRIELHGTQVIGIVPVLLQLIFSWFLQSILAMAVAQLPPPIKPTFGFDMVIFCFFNASKLMKTSQLDKVPEFIEVGSETKIHFSNSKRKRNFVGR